LESLHADIFQAVMQGKFTVKKSTRPFSAILFDQSHEQLNRPVKDDGGAIGLTENDGALRRWVTCGPEIAHLIAELQETKKLLWQTPKPPWATAN